MPDHFAVGRSEGQALELAKFAAEMDDDCLLDEDVLTDHKPTEDCWCQPTLVYTAANGNRVWQHHRRQ